MCHSSNVITCYLNVTLTFHFGIALSLLEIPTNDLKVDWFGLKEIVCYVF